MPTVNKREKQRLGERMRQFEKFPTNSPEHIEGRRTLAQRFSAEDREWERRCRSALGTGRVLIPLGNRVLEYNPATGSVIWAVHSKRAGNDAVNVRKNGQRYISDSDGVPYSVARLAYIAVHGDIPANYEVYCIDNDPSNLRITNLQAVRGRVRKEEIDPDFRAKALEALRKVRAGEIA